MMPEHDKRNSHLYILKLKKNLHVSKQASINSYDKLKAGLMNRDFKPSAVDSCLYFNAGMIMLTYVDDWIFIGNNMQGINEFVKLMQEGSEPLFSPIEGTLMNSWGSTFKRLDDN